MGSHSEEPVTGLPTRRSLREAERRSAAEPVSTPVPVTAPRIDPDSPTAVHHVPAWAAHRTPVAPATEQLAQVAQRPVAPSARPAGFSPQWAAAPTLSAEPATPPAERRWSAAPQDRAVAPVALPTLPAVLPAISPALEQTVVAQPVVPELAAVEHGTARRRTGRPTRMAARLGVLGVLAGITVVIPVSQGVVPSPVAFGSDALADTTLPTTVSALAGSSLSALPPSSLVSADGALQARSLSAASSRTEERSLLAGCDGSVRPAGQNGLLKVSDLCTLWDNHTQLRADAAVSLAEFNQAFAARFGGDLCLASGYRTLAQQRAVKAQKGGLAAAPGKSNHGWGLAVDLCQDQTSGVKWRWITENGPTYGWQNPAWAQPGGSGPHEKWHWEYEKGVEADGEYYDG